MESAKPRAPHGSGFRQFLPDLSIPRFTVMQQQDAHVYAEEFKEHGRPPWLHALYLHWRKLFAQPFKGITTDGMRPFRWIVTGC
jgi:hypothetical protein